jgi:hypothetical protein
VDSISENVVPKSAVVLCLCSLKKINMVSVFVKLRYTYICMCVYVKIRSARLGYDGGVCSVGL